MKLLDRPSPLESTVVIVVGLFLLVSMLIGFHRPMSTKELVTLVGAKQFAEPNFLPNDWRLNLPAGPRVLSFALFTPLVRALPLVKAAIVGRLLGYLFVATGLGLIARRLRLDVVTACVCVALFLWLGQSVEPKQEWIFGPIESKVIGYGFLFLAVHALLDTKLSRAAFLMGCVTSFHLLVGIWGTATLGLTVLFARMGSARERLTAVAWWAAAAAPGLYFTLAEWANQSSELAAWSQEIYVYFRNPHHLIPHSWKTKWDDLIVPGLLFGGLVVARWRGRGTREQRLVGLIALTSILPYAGGLLVTALPGDTFPIATSMLMIQPFRVASSVFLLFGLMIAGPVLFALVFRRRVQQLLLAVAGVSLVVVGVTQIVKDIDEIRRFPLGAIDHNGKRTRALYDVCGWIRENTPSDASILASPYERTLAVPYLCERATPVRFRDVPPTSDTIVEWYDRLIDLNGGRTPHRVGYSAGRQIDRHFNRLSRKQYLSLGEKYGCDYLLVRDRELNLPKLYENDRWAVFALGERSTVENQ